MTADAENNEAVEVDALVTPPDVADDLDSLLDTSIDNEGSDMVVLGRDGLPLRHKDGRPFTITLLSSQSKLFQQLIMQISDKRTEKFRRTQKLEMSALQTKDQIDLLARVTKKWDILRNGEPAPCTFAAYVEAYSVSPYLRDQVDKFVGNVANFTKAVSPS